MTAKAKERIEYVKRTQSTSLDLSNCGITNIDFIRNFTWLVDINLSRNRIIDISPLVNLVNLHRLDLSGNQIEDLWVLQKITRLTWINLIDNLITDALPLLHFIKQGIPIYYDEEYRNHSINIKHNPLDNALIARIKQGNPSIIEYYEQLLSQEEERINEAKVMIIGEPRAGKTTLRLKIKDTDALLPSENGSTKGVFIEQEPCEFKTLDFDSKQPVSFYYHIWDFGGQEVYKPISQLFLTRSTLYLAVINTDLNDNDKDLKFWFETIEKLAGNSPVLVVENTPTDRLESKNLTVIKERFTDMWRGDYQVNLRRISRHELDFDPSAFQIFEHLKGDIHRELERLPHRHSKVPASWARIREEIAEEAAIRNILSLDKFKNICTSNGITDKDAQLRLSETFHILGTFLHYQNNLTLKEDIILNNTWAMDAVYTVLDSDIVKKKGGRFNTFDIQHLWEHEKHQNKQAQLVALMQEFKLCYKIDNSSVYIVPHCLPIIDKDEKDWRIANNVRLTIQYDFMPRATIVQLLVGLHRSIAHDQQWIWQKGGVIDGNKCNAHDTMARIEQNDDYRQLNIRVFGEMTQSLIAVILTELDKVNESYPKLKIGKFIACNCDKCKNSVDAEYYDYEKHLLHRLYTLRRDTIECHESGTDINIDNLLKGIVSLEQIETDALTHSKFRNDQNFEEEKELSILDVLDEVQKLIGNNQTKDAIKSLSAYFRMKDDQETIRKLTLNLSQLNDVTDKEEMGLIRRSEYIVEKTRIDKSLLSIISREKE